MTTTLFEQPTTWEETASTLPRTSTDTDRLLAAVYFRIQSEQVDTADISLIVNGYFRRARWPRPTNLFATANYCASKGWLSEVGKSDSGKLWRITRKGYEYIRSKLSETA